MVVKQFLDLPGNVKIPTLGMGTLRVQDESEMITALNAALECGYRHFDTAYHYQNEKLIGKVLNEWFNSGKVKREELFITTKLPLHGVHPDRVEYFIKKSLENLQLEYIDLYLIHFPIGIKHDLGQDLKVAPGEVEFEGKTDFAAVWKKMEEQVDAGRTKTIGLSNFNISQIETILKTAKIKPANLQIEMHLRLQQRDLVNFCHKNGISVVAYCPLGAPGRNIHLQRQGLPTKELPDVLESTVVKKIAQKHSKTPAQVALRFLLQLGVVPIPKSSNPKRLQENIGVYDFTLDDSDFQELLDLEIGDAVRIGDFKAFKGCEEHPDYPFKK